MAIDVPTGALGRINIPWMTTDPTGWAKVDRAKREAAGLAQLAGGIKRGVTDYMKGGLRGVIDPQYAVEQEKAAQEDAELSARLGNQTDQAVQESKQPSEQGQPTAEPKVTPNQQDVAEGGGGGFLSDLAGIAKKVYEGPGKRYDLSELARKRGMVERQEDLTKRLQAVSPAFRNVEDPGEAISRFMEQGPAGLRGLPQKPPKEAAQTTDDPIYRQEADQAKRENRPIDWDKIERLRADRLKREEQQRQDIAHKYDVPDKDEREWNLAKESLQQDGIQNPTDLDIAKRRRKMFEKPPSQRAGGGTGRTQAAQARYDQAKALLHKGLNRDATEEEITLLAGALVGHPSLPQLLKGAYLPKDFDFKRVFPQTDEQGNVIPETPPAAPAAPVAPGGPTGHGTAQGGMSEKQPDQPPKQTDQRVGEGDRNPARPTEHRKTYTKPQGAPAGKARPDVSIWQ